MFSKILVPLDGSQLAERALAPALTLAQQVEGEVILLRAPVPHTMLVRARHLAGYSLPWADQSPEQLCREAREYLDRVTKSYASQRPAIRTLLVAGDVAENIVDAAEAENADLIAMSSHGYSGLTRWMLGSVAERVLHSAPCPVLVVRASQPVRRILIPLDGSVLSEQALAPAMEVATALGADVTLLRAVPAMLEAEEFERLEDIEHGLGRRLDEELHEEARDYLLDLAATHPRSGVVIKTVVTHEPAAVSILEYAGTHQMDLIAMATHGRTGVQRWVYGSVTEKVLRGARHSMLIIRPPAHPLNHQAAGRRAAGASTPSALAGSEAGVELQPGPWPTEHEITSESQAQAEESPFILERLYMEAYLREKGHTLHSVGQLPEPEARRLMTEASIYASTRLAEVEMRSNLVQELHGKTPPI